MADEANDGVQVRLTQEENKLRAAVAQVLFNMQQDEEPGTPEERLASYKNQEQEMRKLASRLMVRLKRRGIVMRSATD